MTDIPDHLLEPVAAMYRRCKNAQEGTRLSDIAAEIKAEFPNLSERNLEATSRMTATLVINQIDPVSRNALAKASRKMLG